jgi:tetratricopeptide (TPR) repeat protein
MDSWKAIAEYLERSPRTVQRWHACHGLPVHHFGGSRGSVFAYAEDIDHWLVGLADETRLAASEDDDALDVRRKRSHELTACANELWETRSERNLSTLAGYYREAIDANSTNTVAFVGLANAMIFAALFGVMDPSAAYPRAREALRRMPQLEAATVDQKCAEAWINLAYERNWRRARAGFDDLVSHSQATSWALSGRALLSIAEDHLQEAARCAWEAWQRNPLVCSLAALLCWIQYLSGDYARAIEQADEVRTSGGCGTTVVAIEALALIQAGPVADNLVHLEEIVGESSQSYTLQGILGYAYAICGQTDKALEIFHNLKQMNELKKRSNGYALALVLIGLNRSDEAISWLEAAYVEGSLWSLGLRSDPILRPLHGMPRFESLLRKIGSFAASDVMTELTREVDAREMR